ncbi:hypothetical protein [Streptomyces sp. E5N91]|nr:hypothetical protein [Streptomyces sp. E5N91]
MAAKLDCHWHLRKVRADRGMFSTTDTLPRSPKPSAASLPA